MSSERMLEVVRKACLPAIWSQGVKLVREKAVVQLTTSGTEAVVRVRAPGHAVPPTVTLYLGDDEWSCDCNGKTDPCPHVAAAAIALAQGPAPSVGADGADGRTDGVAVGPAASFTPARIVYRFVKRERRLALARVVVHPDGREEPVRGSILSETARARIADLAPTHEDLAIDRIVGVSSRDIVPLDRIGEIFEALAAGAEVTLDGVSVRLSGERVVPRAVVEDGPAGSFILRVERDPDVAEVVVMGVVRVGDLLRPLGETQTTGEFLERLPLTRSFGKGEETELLTNVLPELEKKIPIVVATKRLSKKKANTRPRIALDLSHHGHTLSVLPTLVYGDPPIARVDGDAVVLLGKQVPVRRPNEERELVQRLREQMHLVPGRRVDFDGVEAARFAARLRDFQKSEGDASSAEVFEGRALVPRVIADGERFDVVFEHEEVEENGTRSTKRADTATVLRAWRDGLDLVPLEGGGWAPLPAGWLAEHGHRVADLLAARDPDSERVRGSALLELGALCHALDVPPPLEVGKLAPLLEGFAGVPQTVLPAGVTATLRDYQTRGVDWLSFLRNADLGAVLADDMGLGKTLQTICALEGRALVVCPKSVVYNWAAEITKFRPSLRVAVYHGPKRELDPNADVTLTTYAVLRLDAALLAEEAWDVVVLDEAQAIKNETSQTARAAFELSAKFRVALSGTPVENRLEELWSVMHFANPGLLGGRSDFQDRYVSPIASGDPGAAARLRAKIRPFVLRRMKREVLPELPPRTEAVLYVELEDSERIVYDTVRAATKKDIADKLVRGGGVLAALEALLRLRQASCHSALVPGQNAESSSKVERLLLALEDAAADGHKALVFSQWTSLLDLVEPHLRAAAVRFTRLDGQTRDRAAVVSEFQDPGGPPVMLVSLKAGGTGLNLTAADHVFLLDPWWNPAVEDQAADRAHRIGQDRPVIVYRMVAKDTVEERILSLQERKRALADVALGAADQAGGITRDDLLALLE